MKSSQVFFMALATTLLLGTSAMARGPGQAQQGAAAQSRSAHAGSIGAAGSTTGAVAATRTHAQLHTPGTGLVDPSLATGTGRPETAGVPHGVHTPGTGLIDTSTPVAPASN